MKRSASIILVLSILVAVVLVTALFDKHGPVPTPDPQDITAPIAENDPYGRIVRTPPESSPPPVAETVEPEIPDDVTVVAGHVRDTNGKAIPGVRVLVQKSGMFRATVAETHSDAAGRFAVAETVTGQTVRLEFTHEKYAFTHLDDVRVGATDMDVVMEEKALVRCRVVDAVTKEPVEVAKILVEGRRPDGRGVTETHYPEDGEFEVYMDSDEVDISLTATAGGYATQEQLAYAVHGETTEVVFPMEWEGILLVNVVAEPDLTPVVGAKVQVLFDDTQQARGKTGTDGTRRFDQLRKGTHTVKVAHKELMPVSVDVVVARGRTSEVTVRMGRGGSVEGTVFVNGDPFRGGKVAVAGMSRSTSTDNDGWYRLTGFDTGTYEISVSALDWKHRLSVYVEDGGVAKRDVAFTTGTGRISVHLKLNGKPLRELSDFFSFPPKPGITARSPRVKLVGTGELRESGTMRGRAVAMGHVPGGGWSDADTYTFENLPEGTFAITAELGEVKRTEVFPGQAGKEHLYSEADLGSMWRVRGGEDLYREVDLGSMWRGRTVRLEEGESVSIEIDFRGMARLSGSISCPPGYDSPFVLVHDMSVPVPDSIKDIASLMGVSVGSCAVGPEGMYTVAGLPAGTYSMTAYSLPPDGRELSDWIVTTKGISVSDGQEHVVNIEIPYKKVQR